MACRISEINIASHVYGQGVAERVGSRVKGVIGYSSVGGFAR